MQTHAASPIWLQEVLRNPKTGRKRKRQDAEVSLVNPANGTFIIKDRENDKLLAAKLEQASKVRSRQVLDSTSRLKSRCRWPCS